MRGDEISQCALQGTELSRRAKQLRASHCAFPRKRLAQAQMIRRSASTYVNRESNNPAALGSGMADLRDISDPAGVPLSRAGEREAECDVPPGDDEDAGVCVHAVSPVAVDKMLQRALRKEAAPMAMTICISLSSRGAKTIGTLGSTRPDGTHGCSSPQPPANTVANRPAPGPYGSSCHRLRCVDARIRAPGRNRNAHCTRGSAARRAHWRLARRCRLADAPPPAASSSAC